VNFTGEFVTKGQTIALIYSPELIVAQEELLAAAKYKESQPQLYESALRKLKNWKLSDKQISDILVANKALDKFPIMANTSGYVTKKIVQVGDYLMLGAPMYDIVDLSKVWVLLDVYESDLMWVKKGDMVSFTISSLPGKTFSNAISFIDPVIDPVTRVAKARLEIDNQEIILKPEMFVSATIESKINSKSSIIVIPKSAVMWTGKRSVVYVMNTTEQGVSFIMREVVLGNDLGESYVIASGLNSNEEIATNGTFSIDAAAQLAGKPSMMSPDGGAAMTGHNHGEATTTPSPTLQNKEPQKKENLSTEAKEALLPLFIDYLKIKDALVSDNLEEVQKAASLFQNDLTKINMSLFTGDAHQVWMNSSSDAKQAMLHAAHFQDIKEMRKAFIIVSNSMIILAKFFDPLNEQIYIQHCPMADSNKGADWLSLSEEIKNPYFGAAMLGCGEIIQTIQ
jgi:membrane fusion protein, copper/silver efflux system